MEEEYNTRIVILVSCFLIIVGFGFLFSSYLVFSSADFGYPDIDEQEVYKVEETTRFLNIVGYLAIVIGTLIIIMTGLNIIYKKNQDLEQKMDYILDQLEIRQSNLEPPTKKVD